MGHHLSFVMKLVPSHQAMGPPPRVPSRVSLGHLGVKYKQWVFWNLLCCWPAVWHRASCLSSSHYPSPLLPPPCFSFSSVVRIKWDNVYRGLNTVPGYKWWLPPPPPSPSPPLATSSLRGCHGDGSEEEQALLFVNHYLVCSKGYWAPKVKMTDLNSHCRVPAQLGCEYIRESIPYFSKPTCRLQTVSTGISFFIPAWDLGGFAPLWKIDFYFFRAVLGPEQNWAEITEIFHMLLAPTQTQPPPLSTFPTRGHICYTPWASLGDSWSPKVHTL